MISIIALVTVMAMIGFGLCVLLSLSVSLANSEAAIRLTNATRGADVVQIAHPQAKGPKRSAETCCQMISIFHKEGRNRPRYISVRAFLFGLVLAVPGTTFAQDPPACGVKCGKDRWTLKTLTDLDVNSVDFTTLQKKRVAQLVSLPRPAKRPKLNRVAPTELQTFEVEANLTEFGTEKDRDFHIVIADLNDPSKTMVVEIADSACQFACASKHFADFLDARKAFITHCGAPATKFKRVNPPVKVTVTGVGFFDPPKHGTGAAANGIELHPVLNISFDPDNDVCKTRAAPVN